MLRSLFLVFLFFFSFATSGGQASNSGWTPEEEAILKAAKEAEKKEDWVYLEALYRQLLERHPSSAGLLNNHAFSLYHLHRLPEAEAQCRRALRLSPDNIYVLTYLGFVLKEQEKFQEALPFLEKSLQLRPADEATAFALAHCYFHLGDKARAAKALETMLAASPPADRPRIMSALGSLYERHDDPALAVHWWRLAADQGDPQGIDSLAWAYDHGYGVTRDRIATMFWAHRLEGARQWIPRLKGTEWLVTEDQGWWLVLFMLLAAAIVSALTLLVAGSVYRWGLTGQPSVHWTERARQRYSFSILTVVALVFVPGVWAASVVAVPGFALPVSRWVMGWMMLGAAATGIFLVSMLRDPQLWMRWEFSGRKFGDSVASFFLFCLLPVVAAGLLVLFPLEGSGWSVLVLLATALFLFWYQTDGWISLGRWLGLIVPADAELSEAARALADQHEVPPPAISLFHGQPANAYAIRADYSILVTQRLQEILSPEELKTVLLHELAHLYEDRSAPIARLIIPLNTVIFFLSFRLAEPWMLVAAGGCALIYLRITHKSKAHQRQMEERADAFTTETQPDLGTQAAALTKLHEDGLIPAVWADKASAHPALYDRLIAAGITPDYPRPDPPGTWSVLGGLLLPAINGLAIVVLWFLVF